MAGRPFGEKPLVSEAGPRACTTTKQPSSVIRVPTPMTNPSAEPEVLPRDVVQIVRIRFADSLADLTLQCLGHALISVQLKNPLLGRLGRGKVFLIRETSEWSADNSGPKLTRPISGL